MNTDLWLEIHGGGLFFSTWAEAQTSEFPCCFPLLVSRFSWHCLSLRVSVHRPVTILQHDTTPDLWASGCVFMMRLQLIVSLLGPSRDSTSRGQCGTIIFIIENHLHVSGPTQSKLILFMGQLSLTSVWTLAYKVPGFIPTSGSRPSIFRLLDPNHQESLPFSVVHWLQLLRFRRHVFQACFISHVDCVSLEVRGIHPQLD